MLLLVMCPKCKNRQKTNPKKVASSVKTCVYCGHRFRIHSDQKKSRIIRKVES
jgi:Zn ribbon nucleic-acid-binding protein